MTLNSIFHTWRIRKFRIFKKRKIRLPQLRSVMINKILSKSNLIVKKIKQSHLIEVLRNVCELAFVKRSESSSTWNFKKTIPFLEENGLNKHITFVSRKSLNLPLNSERHLYGRNDIIIRNLHIDLDDREGWDGHDDWAPLCFAKWHFENCNFSPSSPNMWNIVFPWFGTFRFYNNNFDFGANTFGGRSWLFGFQKGSRILFQGNDFKESSIQSSSLPPKMEGKEEDDQMAKFVSYGLNSISFVGNKGISELLLLEGYSSIEFTGTNRIERLSIEQIGEVKYPPRVYCGPREKIDREFNFCLQHRKLFLSMKHIAAANHDSRQIRVLDKQIDRIEYHLNKEQNTPSLLDCRNWMEYWQDRILYGWRRWSSDFYKSWFRPFLMVILGYLLLNAVPGCFIDTFSLSHWIEFTFRPIGDIAGYEESLKRIVGTDYDNISSSRKNVLRFVGLIEVIWIGMWSFAFAKAIRR